MYQDKIEPHQKLITSLIKELTIFNPIYFLYKKDIFVKNVSFNR